MGSFVRDKGVIVISRYGIVDRSLSQASDTVVDPLCHGADEEALAGRRTAPVRRPGWRPTPMGKFSIERTLVCSAVVMAIAAGCGSATTAAPSNSIRPSASATSTSRQDTASDIEHVYVEFWAIGNKVIHDDPATWSSELAAVAVDPQLTRMLSNLNTLRSRSVTVYGETREHVTKIDVEGAAATVSDCQDASGSGQADAKTGEHRTVGVPRSPVSVRMQRGADGKWRVADVSYPKGGC
jgi:hypothetical protein